MKAVIGLSAVLLMGFVNTALAADPVKGKAVFERNCAGCHFNGGNALVAEKTLKKSALAANKINTTAAIIKQVTEGKPPMPAFAKTLSAEEIENVAAYVLQQAQTDWQ
jgi:cytochrome c6